MLLWRYIINETTCCAGVKVCYQWDPALFCCEGAHRWDNTLCCCQGKASMRYLIVLVWRCITSEITALPVRQRIVLLSRCTISEMTHSAVVKVHNQLTAVSSVHAVSSQDKIYLQVCICEFVFSHAQTCTFSTLPDFEHISRIRVRKIYMYRIYVEYIYMWDTICLQACAFVSISSHTQTCAYVTV